MRLLALSHLFYNEKTHRYRQGQRDQREGKRHQTIVGGEEICE
jgi:hypothetical protein